jgi:predicted  nucleic acid-binding Zn-ribbon protein
MSDASQAPVTEAEPSTSTTDSAETTTEAPADLSGLKKALDAERKLRRDLDKRVKELSPYEKQVRDNEEANKSELQKLNEALNAEKAARSAAELSNLRHEIGLAKNVPAGLIKYLTGSSKEELESAADDLLAQLEATGPRVPGRPQERMSDGTPSSSSLDGEDPLVLSRKARGQTTS